MNDWFSVLMRKMKHLRVAKNYSNNTLWKNTIMLIGVNWTSPHNYPIISQLTETGDVDFCEILIDNFLIYEPEKIKESLPIPLCSFHIMNSHFLQRDLKGLQ